MVLLIVCFSKHKLVLSEIKTDICGRKYVPHLDTDENKDIRYSLKNHTTLSCGMEMHTTFYSIWYATNQGIDVVISLRMQCATLCHYLVRESNMKPSKRVYMSLFSQGKQYQNPSEGYTCSY